MLRTLIREHWRSRAPCSGCFAANSIDDDIELYADDHAPK